jgi:hypothetical protein
MSPVFIIVTAFCVVFGTVMVLLLKDESWPIVAGLTVVMMVNVSFHLYKARDRATQRLTLDPERYEVFQTEYRTIFHYDGYTAVSDDAFVLKRARDTSQVKVVFVEERNGFGQLLEKRIEICKLKCR